MATALGFDYGLRRLGVAVAEIDAAVVTPLTTLALRDGQPDWAELSRLVTEWQPQQLVVGMPTADDARHTMADAVERFIRRLHGRFGLPVAQVDERLSSVEAAERLRESRQRGRRRAIDKREIDRLAAAIILETWLEAGDGAARSDRGGQG